MDNNKTQIPLPKEITDLIANPATYEQIELMGNKFALNRVETGLLAQVIGSLLTGEIKPNEFVASIVDYLAVPQEKAMLIAQDINRDIFNSVKDALKQLHSVEENKTPEIKSTPASLATPQLVSAVSEVTPEQTLAPKETVVTKIFEPAQSRPVVMSTPAPVIPAKTTEEAKPIIPFGAIPATPETKTDSNNLESKLGGAFTIKKEVMYTAQNTPTPIMSPNVPTTPKLQPAVPLPQAEAVAPQAKTLDPYRELPA